MWSTVEPDVPADLARDEVVVAGENLHPDAVAGERLERRRGGLLGRIEKPDEAGEHQLGLVSHRVGAVRRFEFAVRDRDDAEAVLVHLGDQL